MKIYFAGSIRGGRDDKDLYFEIIKLLSNYGEVLTEHVGDSNLSVSKEGDSGDRFIYNRDMIWLDEADIVIAEVTTPSLGVGYEIGKAEKSKPVICLYREQEDRELSAMIGGNDNMRIEKYKTLNDLKSIFKEVFSNN